jgi:hypothetical protein
MDAFRVFSLSWFLFILATACGRGDRERKPPAQAPGDLAPVSIHHRFSVPFESRGARPADLAAGAPVWALLPYPAEPKKYRLTPGTLVAADDAGATVENSGTVTGAIPWSAVRPRSKVSVSAGQAVLAAGAAGVFGARVLEDGEARIPVERIWRSGSRREEVPAADLIVQTGTRGFGQIVFFHDRGIWHQGIWIHDENRHAWIVSGLGGAVIRVSEAETQPWNPAFRATLGQEVEACRSGASMLVRATIHAAPDHGLFFEIRLSSGATRTNVPFWEILPAGTIL